MSDGSISQDEIDALLSGVDMGGVGGLSSAPTPSSSIDTAVLEKFSSDIKDELLSKLNTMTDSSFELETPVVEALDRDKMLAKLPEMTVAVMADFSTALTGDHLFVMAPEFAQKLCGLINKEENAELDDMALSVISEVVSNHTGSEIQSLSKGGKLPGLASNPPEAVHTPKAMVRIPQGTFVLFTYPFKLDGQSYTLWEAISESVANGMIEALGGGKKASQSATLEPVGASSSAPASSGFAATAQTQQPMNMNNAQMGQMGAMGMNPAMAGGMNMGMMGGGMMNPGMMGGMNQGMGMMGGMMNPGIMGTPNVQSIHYPNLSGGNAGGEQGNIGLIMDVFMEMTVELGRTKKQIKEILGMGEGTIIELDKLAGEPVDILVNHKPIAKGEVVVIDENFGVRVTEILSPMEKVAELH